MRNLEVIYKPAADNLPEFQHTCNNNIMILANRCNKLTKEFKGLRRRTALRTCIGMIFAVAATRRILDLELKVKKLKREKEE